MDGGHLHPGTHLHPRLALRVPDLTAEAHPTLGIAGLDHIRGGPDQSFLPVATR